MPNETKAISKLRATGINGQLPSYAWPGGYPVYYIDSNDWVLCPDCANQNDEKGNGSKLSCYGINWEDNELYCDDCGTRIESAYMEDNRI